VEEASEVDVSSGIGADVEEVVVTGTEEEAAADHRALAVDGDLVAADGTLA
jgi:hypothetical protein